MLDPIIQLKIFTMLCGSGLLASQILSVVNSGKTKEKLANGHLITKKDIKDILGNDGLMLSKDIQLKGKYNFEGSVIFGATGSKKTTSVYAPNLLSNNLRGSIIVTDPKEELFKLSSGYQQEICKRKVLKFSPLEPDYSEKYNLLTSCKDNMEVLELAQSLIFNGCLSVELSTGKKVGGMEWVQMSQPYLSSALLYCRNLEYPFNTIEFAFQLLITLKDKELDALFLNSKNYDCITQWRIYRSVGKADRTEGSIKITFATNMQLFVDERINKTCSETTFNFEDFRKEPTILYICYPEHRANYISPFIAPFLSKMFGDLIECYDRDSLPITFLCDEAGNIGQIANLANKASTVRSREISVNLCLQGLTQLHQVYGENNTKSILNNLKTKMIFPSISDEEALRYISTLCGEKEIETISKSENKNGSSTSYNKTKIRMFSESDLRCLNDDEFLLVTSNKQPIISKQNTYFTSEKYTKNIKDPVKIERKPVQRYDLLDHIQDLKIDLAAEKEDDYDIRADFIR
jgi:type IV secretion system protein VirD4